MKIGIDGTTLVGKRAGVGRYVFELCRALDRQLPQANFYVYSHIPVEMPVKSERWHARVETAGLASRLRGILWLKMRAGALCKTDNLDFFWASGTFLPKLQPTVKSVATVYDLNLHLVPESMKWTALWAYKLFFDRDIRHARSILAISNGTAERLHRILGRRADGIVVPAVSPSFRRPDSRVTDVTLAKLGVRRPYLLAVGTLEPRKNLAMLVEVFAQLKRMGQFSQHQLVLAGGKGWKDQGLQQLLEKYEGTGILPLGYVADADLPSLYSGSDAFVFPSIYEGFGMPVLEARACETRIVASDIPEIREAGGVGPLYIPPTATALFSALQQVLTSDSVAMSSAQSLPSWDDGARVLAHALGSVPT